MTLTKFAKNWTTNHVFYFGLGLMIISGIAVCISSPHEKSLEDFGKFVSSFTLPTTIILGVNQIKEKRESDLRLAIAAEFKDFNNKKETTNVRKMLEREIQVIELFPDAKDPKDRILNVDHRRYTEALDKVKKLPVFQDDDDLKRKNSPAYIEAAIRDNLDSFFTDLEQIQLMSKSRAIPSEYIQNYMEPWRRMFKAANERTNNKLAEYVARQEYYNVLELFGHLGKDEIADLRKKELYKLAKDKHQEIDTNLPSKIVVPLPLLPLLWLSTTFERNSV